MEHNNIKNAEGAVMAFIGREHELEALGAHYDQGELRMMAVYGRRRVGKTALLTRFCQDKPTFWFTAKEESTASNLRRFTQAMFEFLHEPAIPGGFPTWDDAMDYLVRKQDPAKPFVLVWDEFPYTAAADASLPSTLQILIDHKLAGMNMLLILCGSNEGFMESKVLGYKSPLYGRRNGQIRLKPFDLVDASRMMPRQADWRERILYYATLGGTPYYLNQINPSLGFQDNILNTCFNQSGILYEEPMMLIRQELREPALYNSLLNAIGAGRNRQKEIAEYAGAEATTVSAYLRTLDQLGLIERIFPFGEDPNHSRKGQWRFKDPFFAYWYRFVGPASETIERDSGRAAGLMGTDGPVFDTYVGQQFEDMCAQWVLRQCNAGKLDFLPMKIGKWWGNDPHRHEQTDIDVVMSDTYNQRVLVGECKWREHVNETATVGLLRERATLLKDKGRRLHVLFTKHPVGDATRRLVAGDPDFLLVDAEHMFG